MIKVSCIIPAYNEAARIGNILEPAYRHPLIDELIVVDDASSDGTSDVVKKYDSIRLIRHEKNQGKSRAIVSGVETSKGQYLFFLDADLIGLTAENITDLIRPVISDEADISISLRKNAPKFYRKIGIDFISGERVFPKELISGHLDEINKLSGYGLETFMNRLIIKNNYRIKIVHWNNVLSPWKSWKVGKLRGLWGEIKMSLEILRIEPLFGIIRMIVKMRSLRVK
jgi:glycosyltransferase involved in cell wall biosynthesis